MKVAFRGRRLAGFVWVWISSEFFVFIYILKPLTSKYPHHPIIFPSPSNCKMYVVLLNSSSIVVFLFCY